MSQKLSQMQLTDEQSTQDSDFADRSSSVGRTTSLTGGHTNSRDREDSDRRSRSRSLEEEDDDDEDDDVMLSAGEEEEDDQVCVNLLYYL